MKLSQLYSNKTTFKHVRFNTGLNLVLAKVEQRLDLNKDSHNLGKTTLITVLDYMLLKGLSKGHIFEKHKSRFSGHIFFLEILLNNGEYLTIRRGVDNPTSVSFTIKRQSEVLMNLDDWDETLILSKAVTKLDEHLAFDVLQNWGFRKSVTYFLRSQKDYHDVFQLQKFSIGKDIDWKPFMFDLLGFDGDLLKNKYETDNQIAEQKNFISKLKSKFSVDENEVDKIKGSIELKRDERNKLQDQIDQFSFFEQERSLSKELITEVETNISELNSLEYNYEFELERASSSLTQSVSFNIEQIEEIYKEAAIFFPKNLVKSYSDLEEFNRKITEERNKYLNERIKELQTQLGRVRASLLVYDDRRNQLLSSLKNKDSFKKFKEYQIDLTKVEGDLARLEDKLSSIDRISGLRDLTEELRENLDDCVKQIKDVISNSDNDVYRDVRLNFRNIFKYVLNAPAIIYLRQNAQGNIEFKVDVTKEDEVETTAEGEGNTYEKMLCISFDISVLAAYSKRSFYRFVYHDGALEGLDNRKKTNFISMVRNYSSKYGIQYIFTSIEDDIPSNLLGQFDDDEICLRLNDSGDEGKLFGFSF